MSEVPIPLTNSGAQSGDPGHDLPGDSLAARRLIRALSATDPSSKAVTTETREAICAFVDELKAQQLPPERVLVQIKQLIASIEGDWSSEEQRRFLQQVILWCIEAYYRT